MARATQDTLFGGKLELSQPARGEGYRVNVNAILLADFAQQGGRSKVAFDLGAGVGAVSLALLHWSAVERVTLVEIDPLAAELARANLDANGWSERGEVLTRGRLRRRPCASRRRALGGLQPPLCSAGARTPLDGRGPSARAFGRSRRVRRCRAHGPRPARARLLRLPRA